jgi:hypothetical protein
MRNNPITKFTVLVLIFSLLTMSCTVVSLRRKTELDRLLFYSDYRKGEQGIRIIIQKIYGKDYVVKGELIDIINCDKLVIEDETRNIVEVWSSQIHSIRFPRKSRLLELTGWGALTGTGFGLMIGTYRYIVTGSFISLSFLKIPFLFCTAFGMIAGVGYGTKASVKLEGRPWEEIALILEDLSRFSRKSLNSGKGGDR